MVPSPRLVVLNDARLTVRAPAVLDSPVPRRLVKYWELRPRVVVLRVPVVVALVVVDLSVVKPPRNVDEAETNRPRVDVGAR